MTRSNCPDEETLAAYFDGLLSPAQEELVHEQVLDCPDCQSLMASLGVVIGTGDHEAVAFSVPVEVTAQAEGLWSASVGEQMNEGLRLALKWVGDSLQPLADALQPMNFASVAMRGLPAQNLSEELMFEVHLNEVDLHITVEVDGPGEIAITVKPISNLRGPLTLRLGQGDEVRAVSSLGPSGATICALPSGLYRIAVCRGDEILGECSLELQP